MLLRWEVLDGPSHSIVGELVIACFVIWIATRICNLILGATSFSVRHRVQLMTALDVNRAVGMKSQTNFASVTIAAGCRGLSSR